VAELASTRQRAVLACRWALPFACHPLDDAQCRVLSFLVEQEMDPFLKISLKEK
jgi:hypothetical protein